jgi:hypothetical protein
VDFTIITAGPTNVQCFLMNSKSSIKNIFTSFFVCRRGNKIVQSWPGENNKSACCLENGK